MTNHRGFRFSLTRLFPVQLILALAVSMVTTASARALDCENAMTTADMSQCAQLDYQRADDELNAVYQHLRSMQDKKANLLLRDAQRAWITYRDAECARIADTFRGGSMAGLAHISCLSEKASSRSDELRTDPGTGQPLF